MAKYTQYIELKGQEMVLKEKDFDINNKLFGLRQKDDEHSLYMDRERTAQQRGAALMASPMMASPSKASWQRLQRVLVMPRGSRRKQGISNPIWLAHNSSRTVCVENALLSIRKTGSYLTSALLLQSMHALLSNKLCWDSIKPYTIKRFNICPTLFQYTQKPCNSGKATHLPHTIPKSAVRKAFDCHSDIGLAPTFHDAVHQKQHIPHQICVVSVQKHGLHCCHLDLDSICSLHLVS